MKKKYSYLYFSCFSLLFLQIPIAFAERISPSTFRAGEYKMRSILTDILEEESIESLRSEFNAFVERKNTDMENRISSLNRTGKNYNERAKKLQTYVEETNSIISDSNNLEAILHERFSISVFYALTAEGQHLSKRANNLKKQIEKRRKWITYESDQLKKLDKEYNSLKQNIQQQRSQIRSEITQKKTYVEQEIQEHNIFVTEKKNEVKELQSEGEQRIKEISEGISDSLKEEEQKLITIKNRIEFEYGENYTGFAALAPLVENGDFNQLSPALFSLQSAGGGRVGEAYHIVQQIQNLQATLGIVNADLITKNSLLQSIVRELNQLSSQMDVDSENIESLEEDLENYYQESLREIEEMEEEVRRQRESYAEELTDSFIRKLELYRDIVQNQISIITHVLLFNLDVNEFVRLWTEGKDKLVREYEEEPYYFIWWFVKKADSLPVNIIDFHVNPYRSQSIQKKKVLEGERKIRFTEGWYQILTNRGIFAEEKAFLSDVMNSSPKEIENFFHILFVKGLSSSHVLVEEVHFFQEDTSPGYRLILGGETFWLNDNGNLEQAPDTVDLFQYAFSVPMAEDTELGRQIQEIYQSFKDQFEGKIDGFGEKEKRAIVTAEALLRLAYQMRKETEGEARQFASIAQSLFYLVLNVSPAGDAVDFYECVTGYDIFGEELTEGERFLAGLGLFIGSRKLWTSFKLRFHGFFDPLASKHLKTYKRNTKWHRDVNKLLDSAIEVDTERFKHLIKVLKLLPKGNRVKRVLSGRSDKVAIIGRGLKEPTEQSGLLEVAQIMRRNGVEVDVFHHPRKYEATVNELIIREGANFNQKLFKNKDFYKENRAWVEKLKKENYTILDFGRRGAKDRSIFYDMERSILFGETYRMDTWK